MADGNTAALDSGAPEDVTELRSPTTSFFTAEEENSSAYRSAAGLWTMTMLSRVLGVVRDVLMARLIFGWIMDAFVLGFTIQNLFRRLLGEGTLQAVLVPRVVQRLKKADRIAANRLIKGVATRTLVYTTVLSGVVAVGLLVSSFLSGDTTSFKLRFMAVMFPYGPLVCLAGAFVAGLNAYRHFAVPGLTPVVMNLALIVGLAMVWMTGSPYLVLAGLMAGGILEVAVLLPLARHEGIALKPVWSDDTGEVKAVFMSVLPVAAAVAVFQVNVLADRIVASALIPGDGAVGTVYLAHRLIHLPLALFGINLATVILPRLSALHTENAGGRMERALMDAARMVVFLALPAAAGIAVTALPVAVFLFWGGKIALNPQAMDRLVWTVVFYSPGIVFYSLAALFSRAYYAKGDIRRPAYFAAVAAVLNIVLDVLLAAVFEKRMSAGEGGLALASSLSGLVLMCLLLWGLVPAGQKKGLGWRLGLSAALVVVSTGAMWLYLLPWLMEAAGNISDEPAKVGVALALGVGVFLTAFLPAVETRLVVAARHVDRMLGSLLRIVPAALLTAVFAFLVARSIPPDRMGFWLPLERALAPVFLGAFGYWMLIGVFGVVEYDELRTALWRKRSADTD
ncbi:MAG: murein biosynthesis integral membrane protein MurJ [Planctomycetes bacterium]|nr:murein biosynthesis integral membrane protein MurJ [Planctomycetota bacterium]